MAKSKKRIESYIVDNEQIIGKGAFGQVFLCQHEISKRKCVAKVINKAKLDEDAYMKNAFHQQIQIQSSLKHKNIVEFIDVLETSNNFYIIQEYCQNGTLRQLLNNHKQLSQADALHCLKCICLGFTQIAKKGIIHRDLKPENILINNNELKIADFGFAKQMTNHRHLTGTTLGTPFYMAPQLLKGQKYSSKCDIWSVGVIYYELLYGTHPWRGNSVHQLTSNIEKGGLFFNPQKSISQESQIFLLETLESNENKRLSWLEVFEHRIWKHLSQQENQFKQISIKWRSSYNNSAQKLNNLAVRIQIEELVASFLQLQATTLSFEQFKKVMLWLLNVQDDQDIGTMYEMFDKDCNGVIDFEEFVTSFGFKDGYIQTVELLKKLIEKGHFQQEILNQKVFVSTAIQLGFSQANSKKAYKLIQNIEL